MNKFVSSVVNSCKEHSPQIMLGLGIATGLVAIGATIKSTVKAVDIVNAKKQEYRVDVLDGKIIVKETWKCYILPAILYGSSCAFMCGAVHIGSVRNAALTAACSVAETALVTYKDKVIEVIGAEKEHEIRDKIHEDEIRDNPVSKSEVIITEKGNTLCYEPMSGRYFRSDIEKIRKAVNELNKTLIDVSYISVNEWYDKLGLEPTDLGYMLGWNVYKGLVELDFSTQLADDGEPALVLDIVTLPRSDYTQIW